MLSGRQNYTVYNSNRGNHRANDFVNIFKINHRLQNYDSKSPSILNSLLLSARKPIPLSC